MENLIQKIGERAEKAVCDALKKLPFPWQHFSGVEWRTQRKEGESLGETDVILLVGIDQLANTHKELLYVGSTRAKACLHIFAREGIDNFLNTDQV